MARRIKKLNKNMVELKFNSNFYLKTCILAAVKDFGEICSCRVKEGEKDIFVVLKAKDNLDAEKLGYEFSSYVLGVMKNKGEV